MEMFFFIMLFINGLKCQTLNVEKLEFCTNLECNERSNVKVCGIREEGEGYRLKLFENECELLKYGCQVENDKAYGIINIKYCEKIFSNESTVPFKNIHKIFDEHIDRCLELNCAYLKDFKEVCGIEQYGAGFKVRLFQNECQLQKYNCETNTQFNITQLHVCDGMELTENNQENNAVANKPETPKLKNIVVVDGSMLYMRNNINDTIDDFFASTHILNMPVEQMQMSEMNDTTRRMLLKIFGPVTMFKPWTVIPENRSDDYFHKPTLRSCFHTCPTTCPEIYAPVCGKPGIVAREPSLMFQNHCFMDVAQCKMYWENKSPTSLSSNYMESTFMFCLGYELSAVYRFLPLLRTLQHMGRIKKKGHFRYKFKNMRFFNNLLSRDFKIMG